MKPLKPIDPNYSPGYPAKLSKGEVDELLRPSLVQRFSGKVLRAGAALGGAAAMTLAIPASEVSAEQIAGKAPALKAKSSRQLDRTVKNLIAKLRGPNNSGRHPKASPMKMSELTANPLVVYPRINVFYGNSYMGIIDTKQAKSAAKQLFSLYGINLQYNVRIQGNGYEFVADGYDPATKTGYELLEPAYVRKALPPADVLEQREMKALDADVRADNVRFYMARTENFRIVDIDPHASWTYYLESVADYLRWLHGNRRNP